MKEETNENMDELLILYLKGLANEHQRFEARKWINASIENKKYFEALKDFFRQPDVASLEKYDVKKGWERVQRGYYRELSEKEATDQSKTNPLVYRLLIPVAAALMLAFLTGLFVYKYTSRKYSINNIAYNEIIVPLGAKSQVTLSDGTKVWLNAGSKFRYPILFGVDKREVFLEGEAFFDVTHNEKRLFLVKTRDLTVKVFGTQFNLKSYPEEKVVTTTLVKGSVAIETKDKSKPDIYLKPNQTAILYKETIVARTFNTPTEPKEAKHVQNVDDKIASGTVKVENETETAPLTSWKDKQWIIDSQELGELAVVFERRYNVKISFADSSLLKYTFTGTLTDQTFEQVLKIIQLSAPIKFEVSQNRVILREDHVYKQNLTK